MLGKTNGVKQVFATINAPLQPFFELLQINLIIQPQLIPSMPLLMSWRPPR